ncbi:MAG: glutaredoxin family protein [Actinomycetota bacterium]
MTARVTMYTREGCHLCDDALEVVAAVCEASGSDYQLVDIDNDPELRERYGEQVPVVTVDGATVGFWRIDQGVLTQALA